MRPPSILIAQLTDPIKLQWKNTKGKAIPLVTSIPVRKWPRSLPDSEESDMKSELPYDDLLNSALGMGAIMNIRISYSG